VSDRVKLTKKQREGLDNAPRKATGQDKNTLDPKERLNRAGIGWMGGPEIIVSAPTGRPAMSRDWGVYRNVSDKKGYTRGTFSVHVIDAEVFLSSHYGGYAFGLHDPYFSGFSRGTKFPPDTTNKQRDNDRVLIQADRVAKAMQDILVKNNEPEPSLSDIRKQSLENEVKLLDNTLHHLNKTAEILRQSNKKRTLILAEWAQNLKDGVEARRLALDVEVQYIEAQQSLEEARAALT
jgi:hypothetical protein